MNDNKVFCGSAKKVEFRNGGSILKMTICVDDLIEAAKEHGWTGGQANKQYIRVEAKRKREPDDRGNTHYLEVDTWKPDGQQQSGGYQQGAPRPHQQGGNPFESYKRPEVGGRQDGNWEEEIPF